jgi:hypothetical protein
MNYSSNVDISKMKNDIAEKYLEEFKSELNFLQKIAISPINKKLKEMMIS